MAFTLAFTSFYARRYDVVCALQMVSYMLPMLYSYFNANKKEGSRIIMFLLTTTILGVLSYTITQNFEIILTHSLQVLQTITPLFLKNLLYLLFPITEFTKAYESIQSFVEDPEDLHQQICQLLFVTFNIQISMGYLGIDFLTREQIRKNELVRIEVTEEQNKEKKEGILRERAKAFRRGAPNFIMTAAVPYMLQIIFLTNLNQFAYFCFRDEVHRDVRINDVFKYDYRLVAMTSESAISPESYAASIDNVVSTTYDIFNRKIFSLPKLLLLPSALSNQPGLLFTTFPIIFLSDLFKGKVVAMITNQVETLGKEIKQLKAKRTKLEQFDLKHAELLQRSGEDSATVFTKIRWLEITEVIQSKDATKDLLKRTHAFFGWLQRNFIMIVLIDCGLSKLIQIGRIGAADIFVLSRAIEDAVDLLLMRSRAESDLATMMTDIEKLGDLREVWRKSGENRRLLHCFDGSAAAAAAIKENVTLAIQNLHYSRGTAVVHVDNLELTSGIYAITGANGSGKSTLFRVLMSCDSNKKSIDLPESIILGDDSSSSLLKSSASETNVCPTINTNDETNTPSSQSCNTQSTITLPSPNIVEISQTFYWPLYTKPIDWIYQRHSIEKNKVSKIIHELNSLYFTKSITKDSMDVNFNDTALMEELESEKEDWFSELSGGQKSKVELVRKVSSNPLISSL